MLKLIEEMQRQQAMENARLWAELAEIRGMIRRVFRRLPADQAAVPPSEAPAEDGSAIDTDDYETESVA